MNKVTEELLLSVIFVGKWLAIGFGGLGILYVAISLAYHKSYLDPRLDILDFETSELVKDKSELESSIQTIKNGMEQTKNNINRLEVVAMPKSDLKIQEARKEIEALGLNWWEKIPLPMIEKDKPIKDAYQRLEEAEKSKELLANKLADLKEELGKSNEVVANLSLEIQELDTEISEKKRKRKKVELDVKGPLFWLGSILGLT